LRCVFDQTRKSNKSLVKSNTYSVLRTLTRKTEHLLDLPNLKGHFLGQVIVNLTLIESNIESIIERKIEMKERDFCLIYFLG